jgi:hypothetical protein
VSGSDLNVIHGNYIGTDTTGTADLGNGSAGVRLAGKNSLSPPNIVGGSTGTTPGGACTGACNLISGNNNFGINVLAWGQTIKGNYIGTNAAGTSAIPNSSHGIFNQTLNVVTGGTTPAERNVISGNGLHGIAMNWFTNTVRGNYIGTTSDGLSSLGNAGNGVHIFGSANGNVIGEGNLIAYNAGAGVGVVVDQNNNVPANNRIQGNSMHSNGGLGIDLSASGVTPNDAGDADAGPNGLQNFPVLTSASYDEKSGLTTVNGTLNSAVSTAYTISIYYSDTCDGSGNGEGRVFIANSAVTTDGSGNAIFALSVGASEPLDHQQLTATATTNSGNTSEFSNCIPAFNTADDDGDGYTDAVESGTPLCGNGINDDASDDAFIDDGCPTGPGQVGSYSEGQFKIGTGPQDPCGANGWPSNLYDAEDSVNRLEIKDITSYLAPERRLGTSPGNLYFDTRWDLVPGRDFDVNWINILDLTALFNGANGSGAFPPMFNGAIAYDKTCPYPP